MAQIDRTGIHQYLAFRLDKELYAINVGSIKEVLNVPKITKVPKMPIYMSGIINLRGSAVPVLDLCKKFSFGETAFTSDTSIIVIEVETRDEDGVTSKSVIGIFSDEVQKVITIEPQSIEPPPRIGIAIDTAFIRGMGRLGEQFIIILDIDKILTENEMQVLQDNIA
jgi:purine-binding chemotaxis protein CheW